MCFSFEADLEQQPRSVLSLLPLHSDLRDLPHTYQGRAVINDSRGVLLKLMHYMLWLWAHYSSCMNQTQYKHLQEIPPMRVSLALIILWVMEEEGFCYHCGGCFFFLFLLNGTVELSIILLLKLYSLTVLKAYCFSCLNNVTVWGCSHKPDVS